MPEQFMTLNQKPINQMNQLINIQAELKAPKNQFNSFGKYHYRNAEDILEALKPLLKKYECTLTLSDCVQTSGSLIYVEATAKLCHHDECVIVTAQAGIDLNTKGMSAAQCFGASSSYARKYALSGLFLLDDNKDADATNTHGKEDLKGQKEKLWRMIEKIEEPVKKASALKSVTDATTSEQLHRIELRLKELVNE
jgi:hypothetical protein